MSHKSTVRKFEDLVVWQRAHELGLQLLRFSKNFPRTDEARVIKHRLLRAGLSIAANIAEGYGGSGGKAFTNYLTIARRSAFETENWLLVAKDAVLIEENEYRSSVSLLRECTAMLSAMIRRLSQDS